MPDDTSTAVISLEVGVAHEEGSHLGLDGLGEQSSPVAENFCERVLERPWLDELDDAIVGHGVSSFGGEVAGLSTATIRPLHPFTPSPTSAHSSSGVRQCPRWQSRDEAAPAAGMDRQTLRDWIIRYRFDCDGCVTICVASGRGCPAPRRANPAQQNEFVE